MLSADQGEIKLKFGTDEPELNATTLLTALFGVTVSIQAINDNLNTGRKIDINIKALQGGSFVIHIEVVATLIEQVKNVFSETSAKTASEVIGAFTKSIQLYKAFKGKKIDPAQTGVTGEINLKDSSGNTVINQTIINCYNNPAVRNGLDAAAKAIDDNPKVIDFRVTDAANNELVKMDRADIHNIVEGDTVEPEPETPAQSAVITTREELRVIKPSLERRLKWDVMWMGIHIAVRMADEDFQKRVARREDVFGAGDVLEVDLERSQQRDDKSGAMVNKEYQVLRVHNHRQGPEQRQLLDMPHNILSSGRDISYEDE